MVQKSESPVDKWFLHPIIFFGFQPSQIGGLSDGSLAHPQLIQWIDMIRRTLQLWLWLYPPKKGALQLQFFIDFR
jgi:hypothetical protein